MTNRIKIKLPNGAEFEAEGSAEDVKAQYEAFMDMMKAAPVAPPAAVEPVKDPIKTNTAGQLQGEPDDEFLKRIFDLGTDGLISLKVLPHGENAHSDGLLLLLYGYRRIPKTENVFAVTLSRAAAKSGIQFERLDRAMEQHAALVRRGGFKRGATYTLNNQGVARAAQIAMNIFG